MLAEQKFWDVELTQFLGTTITGKDPMRLYGGAAVSARAHPGRARPRHRLEPGTLGRRMVNDLMNDARIREHFQFWYFTYDSGNPILFSASGLREALRPPPSRASIPTAPIRRCTAWS